MTPVEFHFVSPDGAPIANTEVEIQLARSGFDEEDSGVIMPRLVTALTDDMGKATVSLLPSPIMYFVTVFDPVSEAALHYKFYVPDVEGTNVTVRLQDIIVDGELSGNTYDEAALLVISSTKSIVLAARSDAMAAAATAVAVANSIGSGANGIAVAAVALQPNSVCFIQADGSLMPSNAGIAGRPAQVYVPVGVPAGYKVTWYGPGAVISDLVNLVPGANYFLSTVPGQIGAAPNAAVGSGVMVQVVGSALSTTTLLFDPSIQITL